jgi:glutaminase
MKKSIETEYDSSVLYQNLSIPESDCFGKEFDTHAFECQVCAAKGFCQTIKHQTSKQRVKKLEQEQPFFDLVNFDLVDKAELESMIVAGQFTVDELVEAIMKVAKADKKLSTYWFQIFCKEYSITTNENGICTK